MFKIILISIIMLMVIGVSCAPSYIVTLEDQGDNVTPVELGVASDVEWQESVITFVMGDSGITVDKVVNVGNFYAGAEADAIYLVRNESTRPITPIIFYRHGTHIDDNSEVEGEGFKDAPAFVEGWVKVTPEVYPIPPNSEQGFVIALTMPEDAPPMPEKWAFQVGVAVGDKYQVAVAPWWLITMR